MLELVDKSPIDITKHKKYMQGAHLIDSLKLANIIKLRNPRLYNNMRLSLYISKKFELNKKTGMMENIIKINNIKSWVTPLYYIMQIAGITYYIKK